MNENWFYAKNNKRLGPFTLAQLEQLAKSGMLQPNDMVLQEDEQKWIPAASLPGLFPPAQPVPVIPVLLPAEPPMLTALPAEPPPLPAFRPNAFPAAPSAAKRLWTIAGVSAATLVVLGALGGWCLWGLLDSGYNLAGQQIPVGTVIREEVTMSMPDGTITILGEPIMGKLNMEYSELTETEVLEWTGKEPTKLKITYLSNVMRMKVTMPNQPENATTENGLFQGRSVIVEKVNGTWRRKLVGVQPTAAQERELQSDYDPGDIYPDRKLKTGTSWKIEGPKLRRWAGLSDALSFQGSGTCTFEKVVEHKNEQCASVRTQMDVKARILDEENREATIEMGVSGYAYRSLKSLTDVESEMNGSLKMTTTVVDEGKAVHVTMAGKVKVTGSEKRR